MISFCLPLAPQTTQTSGRRVSVVSGKPVFFKNKKCQAYYDNIAIIANIYRPKTPLTGALVVDYFFILPRPKTLMRKCDPSELIPCGIRPDRDNLVKGTQDALSKCGFWVDDSQIFAGRIEKYYAEKDGSPRIYVRIRNYDKASISLTELMEGK